MPDIWMDVNTALAEVPVNLMPLIDDTDFKTIEDAIAYNASGMALRWHFVTTGGAYTVTSVTPTTGGTYDWTDQGDSGIYTIEIPASGGASINNNTNGFGWFTGKATGVYPWRGPVIGFRPQVLNDYMIGGSGYLQAQLADGILHGGAGASLELGGEGAGSGASFKVYSDSSYAMLIQNTDTVSGKALGIITSGANIALHVGSASGPSAYFTGTVYANDGISGVLLSFVSDTGTAQSGSTGTTLKLRSGASATNDIYKDQAVSIISGTGAGQTNRSTGYNGTTKVLTVQKTWVTTPDNTSVYLLTGITA